MSRIFGMEHGSLDGFLNLFFPKVADMLPTQLTHQGFLSH
jgi:hypothetical protein